MIQFALFAALLLPNQAQQTDTDVWFYPNIEVTDHSPFDDQSNGRKYDARDVFGASAGTIPGEAGRVVFQDDNGGPSHPDYIEWNTKEQVVINRLVFSWQDDAPGNDWRNLSHFWIYGRRSSSDSWKILWHENTPSHVGRYTMEKKISPETCQLFRAEFIRSSAKNTTAVAPRIRSLEAYGRIVKP